MLLCGWLPPEFVIHSAHRVGADAVEYCPDRPGHTPAAGLAVPIPSFAVKVCEVREAAA